MSTIPQSPQPVSSVDWVTGESTYDTCQMDAAQLWRTAVALAATNARQALPDSNGRIDKAITLVLTGQVELQGNGHALVASQSDTGGTTYRLANGTCDCPGFERAPAHQCKHRLARGLVIRAREIAKDLRAADGPLPVTPETAPASAPAIPAQFLVMIQGEQFVTFQGLLHLAHQQGLLSLKAEFISVSADLALAKARAELHDGRLFEEAGDATPTNVNSRIKPHFARLALTRAKVRALRDALNLAAVCVEELGE